MRLDPPGPVPVLLTVGDVVASVRRAGTGDPLLYLHGAGLTDRWIPLHRELATTFDVVAPDLPGFGRTARPSWYQGLNDAAVHLADLLRTLDIPRAHLVGHSLGAKLAGSFAALYPGQVASLTLVAPAPLPTVTSPQDLRPPQGAAFAPHNLEATLFSGDEARYAEYHGAGDRGTRVAHDPDDPHADPAAWSPAGSPTLYRRLARVTAPRQVLVPQDDRVLPQGSGGGWGRALDVEPVTVVGGVAPTAHLVVLQEPDQIAAAVRRLAGVSPAAPAPR